MPAANANAYLIDHLQSSITPQGGVVSQIVPQVLCHLRQHVESALVCHVPDDLAVGIPSVEWDAWTEQVQTRANSQD